MVKRQPAIISVQPVETMLARRQPEILADRAGSAAKAYLGTDIKKDGKWRYPGGKIVRAPSTKLGANVYTDPKDPGEPRRKIESNFFITLNTNFRVGVEWESECKDAMRRTLDDLSKCEMLARYLKFGPKDDRYANDLYEDVVDSVNWQAAVEIGENLERLHCHVWLTVHHYSQIQVCMPLMQNAFKALYNDKISTNNPYKIKKRPYINVKLLPTSDWAMVIRQYIHKGMQESPSDPGAREN
jgi:hypothetical protein